MSSKLKVKFFYGVDITGIEKDINEFSETVDVYDVQFQWTKSGNINLTQDVLTAMVLYFETKDGECYGFLTESEEAVMRERERDGRDMIDIETAKKELGIRTETRNKIQQVNSEHEERLNIHDK